jgi:hypothetical protein
VTQFEPKGPQGQKRPADTAANAIRVAKILTGEIAEDTGTDDDKDTAAQALGGTARQAVAGEATRMPPPGIAWRQAL